MRHLAIFASGNGSNAENIIQYFKNNPDDAVMGVFCNNPNAFVIDRAKKLEVPCFVFGKKDLYESSTVFLQLQKLQVTHIILAGFLWLIPENIIENYSNRIINIHPALLPKYGGKGMYGNRVHSEVIKNKETESGISIHFVNKNYDEGDIIFQSKCNIDPINETIESLACKIHALEQMHFPRVIEQVLNQF